MQQHNQTLLAQEITFPFNLLLSDVTEQPVAKSCFSLLYLACYCLLTFAVNVHDLSLSTNCATKTGVLLISDTL